MAEIIKLKFGDKRAEELFEKVSNCIYKEGDGLPIPIVIGVIELIKKDILDNL